MTKELVVPRKSGASRSVNVPEIVQAIIWNIPGVRMTAAIVTSAINRNLDAVRRELTVVS